MSWSGGALTRDMYNDLQDGMVRSAEKVADRAKQLVPVGEGVPMHLRDTIRARGKRKKPNIQILATALAGGGYETALPGAFVFAGDRDKGVYWAHMVEFGTYEADAHPYMRPAVDSNFNAILAEAQRSGQRALNRKRRARVARRKALA